jgi:hypothetical protein
MKKLIDKMGGPKMAALIAVVLAAVLIFGFIQLEHAHHSDADVSAHGHEH